MLSLLRKSWPLFLLQCFFYSTPLLCDFPCEFLPLLFGVSSLFFVSLVLILGAPFFVFVLFRLVIRFPVLFFLGISPVPTRERDYNYTTTTMSEWVSLVLFSFSLSLWYSFCGKLFFLPLCGYVRVFLAAFSFRLWQTDVPWKPVLLMCIIDKLAILLNSFLAFWFRRSFKTKMIVHLTDILRIMYKIALLGHDLNLNSETASFDKMPKLTI